MDFSIKIPIKKGIYLGDPCFALSDKDYDRYINDEGIINKDSGEFFAAAGYTRYGDGLYQDQDEFDYPVESGMIAAIPLENCDPRKLKIPQGRVFEEGQAATFSVKDGTFTLEIETTLAGDRYEGLTFVSEVTIET